MIGYQFDQADASAALAWLGSHKPEEVLSSDPDWERAVVAKWRVRAAREGVPWPVVEKVLRRNWREWAEEAGVVKDYPRGSGWFDRDWGRGLDQATFQDVLMYGAIPWVLDPARSEGFDRSSDGKPSFYERFRYLYERTHGFLRAKWEAAKKGARGGSGAGQDSHGGGQHRDAGSRAGGGSSGGAPGSWGQRLLLAGRQAARNPALVAAAVGAAVLLAGGRK